MKSKKIYFFLAILYAFFSSLRIPFLPEIQLLVIITVVMMEKKIGILSVLFIVSTLTTHHFVIPDAAIRFDSTSYPSIYTRSYGGVKLLDIMTVYLFCFSIHRINTLIRRLLSFKCFPFILFVSSFLGLCFLNKETFSLEIFLFLMRSYLLFFVIFLAASNISKDELLYVIKIALCGWASKMLFAILIPHASPLYREIFGLQMTIFFAGDEYLDIPSCICALFILSKNKIKKPHVICYIVFVLILVLIAQRKGGIPLFFVLLCIVYFYYTKKRWMSGLIKTYTVLFGFLQFAFLYNVDSIFENNPLFLLAFEEYHTLSRVSFDSIVSLWDSNPLKLIFGISPFGKYEINGLPEWADHPFSFGAEVGKQFRYMLWVFPMGRCILNAGLLGFLLTLVYMLKSTKYSLPVFYCIISCLSICTWGMLTPFAALGTGLVFSAIYIPGKEN